MASINANIHAFDDFNPIVKIQCFDGSHWISIKIPDTNINLVIFGDSVEEVKSRSRLLVASIQAAIDAADAEQTIVEDII